MSDLIRGSQTEKNLLTAFAGESQARNRYTYFASQAKKENLPQRPVLPASIRKHTLNCWVRTGNCVLLNKSTGLENVG